MPRRNLAELLALLKTDPGELTPAELKFVRAELRRQKAAEPKPAYDHGKQTRANRRRAQQEVQDIGELPPVKNLERKAAATGSLLKFCEYFPERFYDPFSPDHITLINAIEQVARHGGKLPVATFRDFGKSVLAEIGALWAAFTGLQKCLMLIAATRGLAIDLIDSIKTEIEGNDLLGEDWPEVCFPIRALEGEARRCLGQRYKNERTHITWKQDRIILPMIPGSLASEAIITVAGITGAIRGKKFTRQDGQVVRPSFVIIDDPQTKDSAGSKVQTEKRERTIKRDILGLAGKGKPIAVIMPCTTINLDDLTCRIFDKNKNPQWSGGVRLKMLYQFPTTMRLWEQYAQLRDDEFRNGGHGEQATEFYAQNREAMDAGAVVAWPEKYDEGELSAVQHALNLYFEDPAAFAAERQNEPMDESKSEGKQLDAKEIAVRLNGLARGFLPLRTSHVTAFIDVQANMLFWLVAAWSDDFTGSIVDYGTWPDQKSKRYFSKANAQYTFESTWKDKNPGQPMPQLEGLIYSALTECTQHLLGKTFPRTDGTPFKIEKLLIDSGRWTETVFEWCIQAGQSTVILPSRGVWLGATSRPFVEHTKRPDTIKLGTNWEIVGIGGRARRRIDVIANYWKSFCYERLSTALGDLGALTLFGVTGQDHRLIADHFCAEYWTDVTAKDRCVREWKIKPDRDDNDWWDCIVGAAAAASVLGCCVPGTAKVAARPATNGSSKAEYERRRREFEARRGF